MKQRASTKMKKLNKKNKHQESMGRDLNRVIKGWHRKRIPVEDAVELSIDFIVNFAFYACKEASVANHLIVSAISRELILSGEVNESDTIIH